MTVRRSALALAASAAALATALASAAPAAVAAPSPSPKPVIPSGLYGTKDPAYDGVWRQSLSFLAQLTQKVRPAEKSVEWLLGQQCDSGAFPSYRPDPAEACGTQTMLDTNATAAAVQALDALGDRQEAVEKSVVWLKTVQNADGGWGYNPGSPSDTNSTAIVIGALAGAGEAPGEVRSTAGKSPYDALVTFSIPCGQPGGGAFAYQPDKKGKLVANGDATAAGVLGGLGKGLVAAGPEPVRAPACEKAKGAALSPDQSARNGAFYLAGALARTGHLDLPPMPGAESTKPLPDVGNTADAVVALAGAGHKDAAEGAIDWLEKNAAPWAKEGGPAAYAQLILAARATGADPRAFGGIDLVHHLNATGPAPAVDPLNPDTSASPSPSPSATDSSGSAESSDTSEKDDDGGVGVWWIVGVFFVASVGVGFLLSSRKRNQQS
ncbi:prenyltransferase/squalene oxidase repeat-containing protein [Streptomyces sp. NPDC050504]|uniref:prenyltransferase/squalene oxidase repeat-containing protein n=1 Tax=Streptomyces sp. NPDC050504 TaxID=3365618 RepID=UPI0037992CAA